VLVLTPKE